MDMRTSLRSAGPPAPAPGVQWRRNQEGGPPPPPAPPQPPPQ